LPSFHNTRRAMEEGIVLRIRRRYFTDGLYGNDIRTIRHSWCCCLGFGVFFSPLQNPKLARVLCCSPSRAFTQIAANGMGLPLRSANERSLAFGAESSTTSNNNASLLTTLLYLSKVYQFNDTRLVLNHKISHPHISPLPLFRNKVRNATAIVSKNSVCRTPYDCIRKQTQCIPHACMLNSSREESHWLLWIRFSLYNRAAAANSAIKNGKVPNHLHST